MGKRRAAILDGRVTIVVYYSFSIAVLLFSSENVISNRLLKVASMIIHVNHLIIELHYTAT